MNSIENQPNAVSSSKTLMNLLRELYYSLTFRRRRQVYLFVYLLIIGAVAEIASIGSILPFLAVISDPEIFLRNAEIESFFSLMGLDRKNHIVIAISVLFGLAALIAAVSRVSIVYVSQRFAFSLSRDLGIGVFSRTLHQPYSYHIAQNSSEILANLAKAQLITSQMIIPLMQATSALVIGTAIVVGLLIIDPIIIVSTGAIFGITYWLVIKLSRATMIANGIIIARSQEERLRAATESIGGIRDVLLDQSQAIFITRFAEIEARLGFAQSSNNFVAQAPRFIIEGFGLALISGLATILSFREGGMNAALPLIGALALGFQRLLPLIQQAFLAWAAIKTAGPMLQDVINIMRLSELPQISASITQTPISFERDIVFSNVTYSYANGARPAVHNLSVKFPKGCRVGFSGRTGSGKSTIVDLLLGLLEPSEGHILIDGREITESNRIAWQNHVAHVPQFIYLSDTSIAENIAFGVPLEKINLQLVAEAATKAELIEVIKALPHGYDTLVGERGVRLSGGQRQRIGIARALYKKASVLVFDEATSSLDTETEMAVMKAVNKLGNSETIFIIAHRLSTLEECDFIVNIDDGKIVNIKFNSRKIA